MVAIFTGLGAGVERGSAATLGGSGLLGSSVLGRGGEGVFLNAATGNLILSRRDEFLVGLGPDVAIARTYNSVGALDENGDQWRQSTDRRVALVTGTLGASGSKVKRVSADGSEIEYNWVSGYTYATSDGAGAHDKLILTPAVTGPPAVSENWTWTEGSTQITEKYESDGASGWRITAQKDTDLNTVTFSYDSQGRLIKVATANDVPSGAESFIEYTWTNNNITSVVTHYRDYTVTPDVNRTITRTTYAYDGSNRLTSVTVDLTPENASDSSVYTTTYTYEHSSKRVKTISQTDLSSVSFEYEGTDTDTGFQRVTSIAVTAAESDTRTTTISYGGGYTEITDPRGQVTKLTYDTDKRLTRVDAPPAYVGATAINVQYAYDTSGNVTRITDGAGEHTDYTYDSAGNVLTITDPNGVVVTREHDSKNNVTLETRTGTIASGSASLYTRYVYDTENHLAFTISAEGVVTEFRYTNEGLHQTTVQYPDNPYTPAHTSGAPLPTYSTMTTWRDTIIDRSTTKITLYTYDARGGLTDLKSYGFATTGGAADSTEGRRETHFVYDQAGQLLQRLTNPLVAEVFTYDGLGRVTSSTDLNGGTTTIAFGDAAMTTTVTTASGYVTISTYNKAGELLNVIDSGSGVTGGATVYAYDKNGQVRVVKHKSSNLATTYDTSYVLYDKMGRKVADIGEGGELTEYRYDAASRLIASVRYANVLSSGQLTTLATATSEVDLGSSGFARPAASSNDIWQWTIYDDGGRIIETIEGDGSVTAYAYDASNRLIKTTGYYNKLSSSTISGYISAPPLTPSSITADSNNDRITRTFYDGDGRVVGALNAEGALSKIFYDAAGQKIREIAYANLTGTTHRASGTFNDLLGSFSADPAKDVSTRYVYDGQGLLRYTIDALNHVTELVYKDGTATYANGAVRKTITYANALGTVSDYKHATIKTAVAASSSDRTTYAVFNDKGQLAYSINAERSLTAFAYDSSGRLIKTTRFATVIGASDADAPWTSGNTDALWLSKLDHWVSLNTASGDRVSRNYYSARGELIYAVDAEGYVTGAAYDTQGRVVAQSRYPTSITATDSTTIANIDAASKGTPVTTTFAYDALGRLADVYDGVGMRKHLTYYANGALASETLAYGQAGESVTAFFYDQAGKKLRESRANGAAEQTDTYFAYDGLGNVSTITDPRGAVTTYTYDKIGRITKVRTSPNGGTTNCDVLYEYNNFSAVKVTDARGKISVSYFNRLGRVWLAVDAANFATETSYTAFGEVLSAKRYYLATGTPSLSAAPTLTSNSFDALSQFMYNKLGRVTLSVDAEGHATKTSYNGFGEIASTRHFANKTTTLAEPTVDDVNDATTNFVYDRRGLLTSTTDAADFSKSFGYDAYRNCTSMTNELGGVTTYSYDGQGLLTEEHLPSAITTKKASDGSTIAVIHKYQYDLRGNVTVRIEAFDAVEQRTTTYAYDKLNRVISKTGDAFNVTSSATAATAGSATAPVEYHSYDKNGNPIKKIDAASAETIYWYDGLNRLTHQVSPLGTLTTYAYDENGNLTETNVYPTLVTLPQNPASAPPTGAGSPRTTQFVYDNLNRLKESKVLNTQTAQYASGLTISATGTTQTTTYEYDARGNVVLVTDANGGKVYSYFDLANRKVAQIDGENYRTSWTYDSNGNVLSERRYATAQGSAPPGITSAAPTAPSATGDDRVTDFTYDKMGRRLTETRASVHVHNGSGGRDTVSSTITYTYNGLGEVLTKKEATNDVIEYAYDVIGRMTSEKRRLHNQTYNYVDYANAQVTPTVTYAYNGLGDLVSTRQGGASAVNTDRVTLYTYGAGGRLLSMRQLVDTTTANDVVHTYRYDQAGRVIRDEYERINAAGANAIEAIGYGYDAEGRVTRQGVVSYVSSAWTRDGAGVDTTAIQYDAFSQVSKRGIAHYTSGAETVLWTEELHYNRAGQLERTNAGDGVWKYFMYDGVGNQTLMIASVGTDLNNASGVDTLAEVLALWTGGTTTIATTNVAGVVASITKYDKRNQALEVREPQRQRTSTQVDDLVTQRVYNAFGEVAYEINAAGKRVDYTYSTMGRLESIRSPDVYATSEAGVVSVINPIEWRYYDKAGRLVASRDANGNLTKLTLLAGTGYGGSEALVAQQLNADAGIVITGYDVYGNARTIKDPLWLSSAPNAHRVEQIFDRLGRVIQINRSGYDSITQTGGLAEYFAYDELGQRIKRWNNLLGVSNAETTAYDQQGRITSQVAMGGDTTSYAYAWSSTLATNGMGTFGGWTQTTTYVNGKVLTDRSDAFGRAVQHTDMSNLVSDFTYDKGGRLTQRTGGDALGHTYFNTGRVATSFATVGGQTRTATFGYDKVGNLTLETLVSGGQQWKSMTATYDALGRIVSWTEAGSTYTPYATTAYEYDANGNIRKTTASFKTLNNDGVISSGTSGWTRYYRFDSMNRVIVQAGFMVNGEITGGVQGDLIQYNTSGERVTLLSGFWDSVWLEGGYLNPETGMWEYGEYEVEFENDRREDYIYDAESRLKEVRVNHGTYDSGSGQTIAPTGPGWLIADFSYDDMGRQTQQRDYEGVVVYSRDVTYNAKSQVISDITNTKQGNDIYRNETAYAYGSGTSYALGSPLVVTTVNFKNNQEQKTSEVVNTYAWGDGPMQSQLAYDSDLDNGSNPINTSTYAYDTIGGQKQLTQASIVDASTMTGLRFLLPSLQFMGAGARTVDYRNDLSGQAIKRDESDNSSLGDPHEVWHRFGGKQMGFVGNNGTSDVAYEQSITMRTAGAGSGPFRNGSSTSVSHIDFDLSLQRINSFYHGGAGGGYIVRQGDTLQSIAANLWGDSSLATKLAEANGLSANATLMEGQRLSIPTGVIKNTHSANTFAPYDPAETIGDTSPTRPKPQKENKCGVMGQIILVAIAIVVTLYAKPIAKQAWAMALKAMGVVGKTAAAITSVATGATAAAAGSIVSQGVGVATGIQDKFSWNAVALAAISGGVGGSGIGDKIAGVFAASGSMLHAAISAGASSAISQGVAMTVGVQRKFDWAGVAGAAAGAAAGQ